MGIVSKVTAVTGIADPVFDDADRDRSHAIEWADARYERCRTRWDWNADIDMPWVDAARDERCRVR